MTGSPSSVKAHNDIVGLFSIHDVMPETLERVEHLFRLIQSYGHHTITLLVVPGRDWQAADIQRLQALVEQGGVLAGHGWLHKVKHIHGLKHRLHSLFISRDVAEHLALDEPGCLQLMQNCFNWFAAHGLPSPELYVPPAWAMGPVGHGQLQQLPFRQYETMAGVYEQSTASYHPSPMLGFEARDAWQVPFIRLWNRYNLWQARRRGHIRVGIHPDDHTLYMAKDMQRYLGQISKDDSYQRITK